jgi:hypothetical protein
MNQRDIQAFIDANPGIGDVQTAIVVHRMDGSWVLVMGETATDGVFVHVDYALPQPDLDAIQVNLDGSRTYHNAPMGTNP